MSRDLENYCWLALRLLLCASVRSTKLTNRHWCVWMHSALKKFLHKKKLLISILTLFYCNFWCTSHFNTPTLIRSALELKMTLLLINKQSKNNINTGCSYCTEPSTNLSLLRYFFSFRAVWYGVCARSWTELMLFKKGSRSHKKVRLILDYMSHKWLHCQIQGESLGGEREEVGLRHSSEEQTNGISLLILKKNMGMLCVRMLLLLFYNSSLHHHHYDCNSIG